MRKNLLDRIEVNPKVVVGKPVIRGTRITVEIILEKLAADIPIDEILKDYPRLKRDDVLAALAYARQAVGVEEIVPRVRAPRDEIQSIRGDRACSARAFSFDRQSQAGRRCGAPTGTQPPECDDRC